MRRLAIIGLALALATPAAAVQIPRPGSGDPRIHVVDYDPAEVVELRGVLGYQTVIEFGPDERIENVAIGDALGWQVTPNRRATLLFLKPLDQAPPTNMTVATNLRRYAFNLSVRPGPVRPTDPNIVFSLKFLYPAPQAADVAASAPPQDVNHAYTYEGAAGNVPLRVFDDGKATYFRFREGEDVPAVFAIEADGGEAVVNTFMRQGYLVVDRLARAFVLRSGDQVTRLTNDGFTVEPPGPDSPKPAVKRSAKRGWWRK